MGICSYWIPALLLRQGFGAQVAGMTIVALDVDVGELV